MLRYQRYANPLIIMSALAVAWVSASQAQYFECKTVATAPDSLFTKNLAPPYSDENLVAEVRCVVHVLRETNGSGGLSASEVDSMLGVARQDMSSLGVTLVITDQSDLSNSYYYADPDSLVADIFTEDYHEDAIDIYLGPAQGETFGLAQGIPGSALLLNGAVDSYSALSHLLGHCLGLYDTDEAVFGVEAPDGSNGATAGDLVADTDADPGLEGWVEADCEFAAAFDDSFPGYDPDPTNIMSGSRSTCWSTFTEFQRARVMSELETAAVLQEVATGIRCGWVTGNGEDWNPVRPDRKMAIEAIAQVNKSAIKPLVLHLRAPGRQEVAEPVPSVTAALTAFPNPFNACVEIRFALPEAGHANLDMYDLQGRRVIRLLSGEFAAGEHSAIWNGVDEAGRTVASGVYLARLQLGGIEFTRSLVVMK